MTTSSEQKSSSDAPTGQLLGDVQKLKADVEGHSVRGSSSLVLSEIGCNVFRLFGTVMLARLLTPEYFGLVGMVTALTTFAEMFKDLGLGTATIQRKEITHEQISTLFWINTGVGIGLMLLMAAAAPFITSFYEEPRLLWVTFAISSTFVFGGLTIQHQALLRRHMQFPQLASIQVLATGLSTVLGVLLAWLGFEYWALVWKEISRAIIQASGVWLCYRWLPGLPRRGVGVRSMFQTGSHVTGFNIVAFASRNLDTVLLGKFWGPTSVGLYKQAGLLLMVPASVFGHPITYVMTSALSALQGEPERYQTYYKKVVSFLAFLYIPCVTYIAVYAENLITLILGGKWVAASPVMQIIACAAAFEPILGTCGTVMITCGRTKQYMYVGIAQASFLTLAVCVGVKWGMVGLAWALVTYTILGLPFLLKYSFQETPISPALFYEAVRWPVIASGAMALILVTIRHVVAPSGLVIELGYSALLAPLIYCGIWLVLPKGKEELKGMFSYFQLAAGEILSKMGLSGAQTVTRP